MILPGLNFASREVFRDSGSSKTHRIQGCHRSRAPLYLSECLPRLPMRNEETLRFETTCFSLEATQCLNLECIGSKFIALGASAGPRHWLFCLQPCLNRKVPCRSEVEHELTDQAFARQAIPLYGGVDKSPNLTCSLWPHTRASPHQARSGQQQHVVFGNEENCHIRTSVAHRVLPRNYERLKIESCYAACFRQHYCFQIRDLLYIL
jgi:hypothetical protein